MTGMTAGTVLCASCSSTTQLAANAAEALRAERQKAATVRHYLLTVPDDTSLDVVRREVAAIYAGEPEPGR